MASDWAHDGPRRGTRAAFDPGVLAAIHQSAAVLARDQDAFIRQFHDDVKSLIPDSAVPPAFDLRAFCDRMAQALLWVALTERQPRLVVDALRQLGGQNWYEGFPDSQYASVAHALIQTVHYLSANIWSTSTGSAWISFFLWVQPHLLAGARRRRHARGRRQGSGRPAGRRPARRRRAGGRPRRGPFPRAHSGGRRRQHRAGGETARRRRGRRRGPRPDHARHDPQESAAALRHQPVRDIPVEDPAATPQPE